MCRPAAIGCAALAGFREISQERDWATVAADSDPDDAQDGPTSEPSDQLAVPAIRRSTSFEPAGGG